MRQILSYLKAHLPPYFTKRLRVQSTLMLDSVWPCYFFHPLLLSHLMTLLGHTGQLALFTMCQVFLQMLVCHCLFAVATHSLWQSNILCPPLFPPQHPSLHIYFLCFPTSPHPTEPSTPGL